MVYIYVFNDREWREKGKRAREEGKSISDNPGRNNMERAAWWKGFHDIMNPLL